MDMKERLKKGLRLLKNDLIQFRFSIYAFAIYWGVTRLLFHAFCPLAIVTGLPCPGCGITRSVMKLCTFSIGESIHLHPIGILWVLYFLFFLFERYFIFRQDYKKMWIIYILAILMFIVYIYRMRYDFPGEAPMTFFYKNVLSGTIPGYNNWILKHF